MGNRNLTFLTGAAVLAASVIGAGCSRNSDTSSQGEGSARISAINLLAYSDIAKVNVTISSDSTGTSPAVIAKPILVPLGTKNGTDHDWISTVQGIPVGNVLYSGVAYDSAGTSIFHGEIKGVITANNTASVLINMFQTTANGYSNSAPVISALQIGTTLASTSQNVSVNVIASDPDAGDSLTYAWTTSCSGSSFASATSATTTWTAPPTVPVPATCVVTVTVSDTHGASTSATASITVQSADTKGGSKITVAPDLAPVISGINVAVVDTATPAKPAAFVVGNVAKLTLLASDDGPTMTYAWTQTGTACTGTFSDAGITNPSFTLASGTGTCIFSVVVTDNLGQTTTASLTLAVATQGGSVAVAAPVIDMYASSSDSESQGQTIYFYVTASQLLGDSLTFNWTGNPSGATGSDVMTVTTDPAILTPNSTLKFVAPQDLGDLAVPGVITVVVTDPTTGLTAQHVWNLPKVSNACANNAPTTTLCDDGNACTTGDHCDGAGACVPGTAKDCSIGKPICKDVTANTCNKATGVCDAYVDTASGTSCNDGNLCKTGEICNGHGSCLGSDVNCDAPVCNTVGACVPATGCPAPTPVGDLTPCSDNNACTTGESCHGGACNGGTAISCTAGTCQVAGTCAPATGCPTPTPALVGTSCSIADLCTTGAVCTTAGTCVGTPKCADPLTCEASTGNCLAPACMQTKSAVDWNVSTVFLASDGGGTSTAPAAYSTGTTYNSVDFGAGAQTESGDTDVYVNRLNMTGSNGSLATWTKDFGDAAAQHGNGVAETTAIVSGSSIGVVGVIGDYLGGMPGTGLPTNTGTVKVDFLLGLNATDGTPIWSKKVDMAGSGFSAISSNPSLGVYFVCGTFGLGTSTAGAGAVDLTTGLTSNGGKDIVVAKINAADGTVMWAKQFGAKGDETCTAISSDDSGANVYITGVYSNDGATANPVTNPALVFGTLAALPDASSTQGKIYVAQLSGSTGTPIHAGGFGSVSRNLPAALTVDASGNVYLGGGMFSTVDFGNSVTLASAGNADAFIVKFNSSLTAQCGQHWGDSALQKINGLATDSAGHVFAVGQFSGSINIGASGALIATQGNSDAFTLTMDASCNLKCGATYGDASGQEADAITVARFATTGQNTAMFGGQFGGSINLSPTLTTGNSSDAYVVGISAGVLDYGL